MYTEMMKLPEELLAKLKEAESDNDACRIL